MKLVTALTALALLTGGPALAADGPPPKDRPNVHECEDGIDNDGDGRTDVGDDPDCGSSRDNSEAPESEPGGTPPAPSDPLPLPGGLPDVPPVPGDLPPVDLPPVPGELPPLPPVDVPPADLPPVPGELPPLPPADVPPLPDVPPAPVG